MKLMGVKSNFRVLLVPNYRDLPYDLCYQSYVRYITKQFRDSFCNFSARQVIE